MTLNKPGVLSILLLLLLLTCCGIAIAQGPYVILKNGVDVDLASDGRMAADDSLAGGNAITLDLATHGPNVTAGHAIQFRGGNVQVNDSSLDNEQIFPNFRPFEKRTQSETTVAHSGNNIVVSYNSSANQPLTANNPTNPTVLTFTHRFLSAFSTSNDGGKTWRSGFVPPVPGSIFTFGDGVVAADSSGNFYYAGLGADAMGGSTVQVNKSTDGGRTWRPAVVVQQDDGSDKEWIAVGPDPTNGGKDSVYVTWTSFQPSGQQIRFGKSTDGGATWTSKTVFAPSPDPDPTAPQNSLQFTTPYVDSGNGRLYISFAQFSNSDTDFLRILRSDDGGNSFSFVSFNIPGASLTSVVPIVQSGELIDCGNNGGFRLSIHDGAPLAGRFGLRTFVQASRLVTEADFAAQNGVLNLAWSNSTSSFFGDPTSGSNILFMRSTDGGTTWTTPMQVNPAAAADIHHVLPALSIDKHTKDVHIVYYTQHTDGTVDLDMTNSRDGGQTFPANRAVHVTSTASVLAPTNIPLATPPTGLTTNYDRTIRPCYNLGEYVGADSLGSTNGTVFTAWGDGRTPFTEPANALDPLSGQSHPQQDVFFQEVKAH
jgi:hypothetical protein